MSTSPPVDLGRIVHDLRGPLMPLRTAAWLMRHELGESARVCELADIVERQSGRLARMMDELSDWARIEGGGIALNRIPVEVALLVDTALSGIADCPVTPEYRDEAAAAHVLCDQHRADQLLRTLVQYAMHRDQGRTPQLEVSVRSGQLTIHVRDHGAPVDAGARATLLHSPQFDPFDDGLGLRLIVARMIAEAHGGRLAVDADVIDGVGQVCSLPALP